MEVYLALQKLERLRKRAPRRIQILRDGDIGIEGWPEDMRLTPTVAGHIIEHFDKMGNKIPIDYHHATNRAEDGEAKAPAAGFVTDLEYVMGDGLYGYVEWNAEGRGDVEGGAFKYLSPVIERNNKGDKKTRDMWQLHSVALTNRPATREQRELLAASLRAEETETEDMPKTAKAKAVAKKRTTHKANDPVLEEVAADPELEPDAADKISDLDAAIESLAEALRTAGNEVPDDYAAEDLIALAVQVIAGAGESEEESEEMPEAASATPADSTLAAQVKAMSASMKSMTAELAAIKTERNDKAVETMIAEQVAANKINPNDESQMHAARLLAEDNPDIFKATYGSLPAYVEPGELTAHSGSAPTGGRAKVIAAAVSEWKGNEFNQGGPLQGYVKVVLDEHGMADLNKVESEKLRS